MEKNSSAPEAEPNYWFISGLSIAFIVICWGLTPWWVKTQVGNSMQDKGQYGDLFGIVNALFSGLGFAGIVGTLVLQAHQLKLQRKDIKAAEEDRRAQEKKLSDDRNEEAKRAENQARDFSKRLEAMKEDQFLAAFNEVYSNLSKALESIVFDRRVSKSSAEREIYVSKERFTGVAAVRKYAAHMQRQLSPNYQPTARDQLTSTGFDPVSLEHYLQLYSIAKELTQEISSEPLKKVCTKMLDGIHKPTVADIMMKTATIFTGLSKELMETTRAALALH